MKNKYFLGAHFSPNMIRVIRITRSIVWGITLVIAIISGLLALPVRDTQARSALQLNTQEITKTAYVVVRYGDHDVVVRRINFTGVISGWGALQLAGLTPAGTGGGLASINGYGNPDDDPYGNTSTRYWATYHRSGDTWAFNMWGVTDLEISDNGHVEGFSWSNPFWDDAGPPLPLGVVAAADGLEWLRSQQSATDGGYGDASKSIEALMAVGANGYDPAQWRNGNGNPSLLAYLSAGRVAGYTGSAAGAGKAAVALAAAQQNVTNYLGLNLVISITTHYSSTQGSYSTEPGEQAWAMLGLRAAQQTVPVAATRYLTGSMRTGGCWAWGSNPSWYPNCDTNGTALAVQALVASGVPASNAAVISGVTWLKSAQNSDGGFPYDPASAWGTDSDTNSTAYVIQALRAAGENLSSLTHGSPLAYLRGMQQSSGQFYWQGNSAGGDPTSSTRQAVPPLLDRPFPTTSVAGLTPYRSSDNFTILYLPLIFKP